MTDASGSRPYLDGPIDFDQTETLIQWATYLGTTFGTAGALCALRYYERLSWISPAVRRAVEQQLRGLSLEEIHSKKYDEPGLLSGPLASLSGTPFGAHAKSLEFVSVLAGDDLEGDMLRAKLAKHQVDADLPSPGGVDGEFSSADRLEE
jgi:archaellum component FlaD/FlaE